MNALKILIFSFLIPNEFSIEIGGLFLNAYRIALLALFPTLLWSLYYRGRYLRWNICDALAFAISLWPFIAFSVNTDIATGVESGGVLAMETMLPYLMVRLHVTGYEQRKQLAKYLFYMVAVLFFLGLPEAIYGRHFTHEFASKLVGIDYRSFPEQRYGIWRAQGPTNHAILFGTLCATVFILSLTLAARKKKYMVFAFFSVGGAIMSASSAPILSLIAQIGILTWATVFKGYRNKWWWLAIAVTATYITIDVLSNRDPIRVMFSYLLLNTQTGYTRYYMWIHSFDLISQSTQGMIFGHGFDTSIFETLDSIYWSKLMSATVDSYWLVLMLRYGVTMLVLFSALVLLTFRQSLASSNSLQERKDRRLMRAYFIAVFALTLIAATVHFWEEMTCVYMMIIAVCLSGKERNRKKTQHNKNKPTPLAPQQQIRRRFG